MYLLFCHHSPIQFPLSLQFMVQVLFHDPFIWSISDRPTGKEQISIMACSFTPFWISFVTEEPTKGTINNCVRNQRLLK
jgi:hypothetical protein